MNEHWHRWIFASLSKWFLNNSNDVIIHVEGDDTEPRPKNYGEFRMDGPRITELNKEFHIWVSVNILVHNTMGTDTHKKYKDYGDVAKAFATCITINKFGDTPIVDDDSEIGYMRLLIEQPVTTTYFGQRDSKIREEQAAIMGRYEMYLEGT